MEFHIPGAIQKININYVTLLTNHELRIDYTSNNPYFKGIILFSRTDTFALLDALRQIDPNLASPNKQS